MAEPVDVDQLAAFLEARADEIEDDEAADFVYELASEVQEVESAMVLETALRRAATWDTHPDYRPEWR